MQRIGRALHVSSNRNLILKAEKLPRIGDKVFDEHLKPVGAVFDIFGPVVSPYVSVKTSIKYPHHFVNHVLYVNLSSRLRTEKEK